jgi:hypothetical protein
LFRAPPQRGRAAAEQKARRAGSQRSVEIGQGLAPQRRRLPQLSAAKSISPFGDRGLGASKAGWQDR